MKSLLVSLACLLYFGNSIKAQNPVFDSTKYYRLTNMWQGEGKSLDIINDKSKDHPLLSESGAYSGQSWRITTENGYFRLTTAFLGTGKSLDVINDGQNNRVAMRDNGVYSGQYWTITPMDNGYYRLGNLFAGTAKSLDVINDTKNNNELWLDSIGEYSGQYWKIELFGTVVNTDANPTDNGWLNGDVHAKYRITNLWQGDNKSLDVVNDGKKNDRVWLYANKPVSGQYWQLVPASRPGYYRLACDWLGESTVLGVADDGRTKAIRMMNYSDADGQLWKLTPSGEYYRFTCRLLGEEYSLEVPNDGKANNQISIGKSAEVSGQFWKLVKL